MAEQIRKERPTVFLGKKRAYQGTGRRKTSVARVFLTEGTGQIKINDRTLEDYFTEDKDRAAVIGPMKLVEMNTRLDITVHVHGGGITGQAGAISQGVARALKMMFGLTNPEVPTSAEAAPVDGDKPAEINMAKVLRKSGFLSRDSRMKERKKYGRKGARKSFQFSKR